LVEGHEDDAVRRLEIRRAMSVLDDREQELLALRFGADLTARQIAELLELKTNAVEVALHRALRRLRAHLESSEPDAPPARGAPKPGDDPI
jgi:RNA polymerase sigma factor (sigma-70 family)